MKTKDWFSRFDLLRLRRQSTTLPLVNIFFKTICRYFRIGSPRKARVMATPRRLAAVILAALFPPLPVCAQLFHPSTVPDTQAGILIITNANNALQTAIQDFAANTSAANATKLATAQSNYNTAVSTFATTRVGIPCTVLGSSWPVPSDQASAIFAQPGGTLTFSGQPVINNGRFYLGSSPGAPADAFTFQGSGSPNAIDNTGTATITNSFLTQNFGHAFDNEHPVSGSTVTIINSTFTLNTLTTSLPPWSVPAPRRSSAAPSLAIHRPLAVPLPMMAR
jgi:hypothetical protein